MQNKSSFYRHVAQTSDAPMGLEVQKAEGPYIFTTDGDQYVDFISGIAVSSLGHRHPSVTKAVKNQVDRDRKSTRLNSSHVSISYAVFCLKKKKRRQRKPD